VAAVATPTCVDGTAVRLFFAVLSRNRSKYTPSGIAAIATVKNIADAVTAAVCLL